MRWSIRLRSSPRPSKESEDPEKAARGKDTPSTSKASPSSKSNSSAANGRSAAKKKPPLMAGAAPSPPSTHPAASPPDATARPAAMPAPARSRGVGGLALPYVVVDVFTTQRFAGNPLAIVHISPAADLVQAQKQRIATEFNLSETVFLHPTDPAGTTPIEIFTTDEEIPFAGHPTVGTAWYLGTKDGAKLSTKAGMMKIMRGKDGSVGVDVPTDFLIHAPYPDPSAIMASQPGLELHRGDYVAPGLMGVVSIVKGMTFVLLELRSEDALARLQPLAKKLSLPNEHLGEWQGLVALYAYYEDKEKGILRTRMFHGSLEDPATGSAASALCCYLSVAKGLVETEWKVVQGVEMGRRSEIGVDVKLGGGGIAKVTLRGRAVKVMEGTIEV